MAGRHGSPACRAACYTFLQVVPARFAKPLRAAELVVMTFVCQLLPGEHGEEPANPDGDLYRDSVANAEKQPCPQRRIKDYKLTGTVGKCPRTSRQFSGWNHDPLPLYNGSAVNGRAAAKDCTERRRHRGSISKLNQCQNFSHLASQRHIGYLPNPSSRSGGLVFSRIKVIYGT
ncbi:hypothetical protein BH10PLA1_BH10PLA1_22980 [soil metagenome]